MDDLENFRQEIQEIDQQLFFLISERMKVSQKIGAYKTAKQIPIRNKAIEEAIIETHRSKEGELGKEIAEVLIKYSCAAQEKEPTKQPLDIAVIGGKGAMGRWAERYFLSRGHRAIVIDKHESLDPAVKADVIVLATPIDQTPTIIDQLTSMSVPGLAFDLASIKDPLIPSIYRAQKAGIRMTSIHPMFGPDRDALVDQTILVCGEDFGVSELFNQTCVQLEHIPIEEHDRLICYISALTHLINYLFAETLSECNFDLTIGTLSFKMQLNVAKRVFSNNPDLFYEILSTNRHSKDMLGHLENLIKTYKEINRETFHTHFEKSASKILS